MFTKFTTPPIPIGERVSPAPCREALPAYTNDQSGIPTAAAFRYTVPWCFAPSSAPSIPNPQCPNSHIEMPITRPQTIASRRAFRSVREASSGWPAPMRPTRAVPPSCTIEKLTCWMTTGQARRTTERNRFVSSMTAGGAATVSAASGGILPLWTQAGAVFPLWQTLTLRGRRIPVWIPRPLVLSWGRFRQEEAQVRFVKTQDEVAKIQAIYSRPQFMAARSLTVVFETKPEALRALLPPPLEPTAEAIGSAWVGEIGNSNCVGPFLGAAVYVRARYRDIVCRPLLGKKKTT